jgi:ribonucleoside-diphosphate reductase beta chain
MAWDPSAIDLSQDREDWSGLSEIEQAFLLQQVVGFLVGERGVAHDLPPLQQVLRRERGRMAEEMYLTQQTYEESIHVEFFERWVQEVLPGVLGKDIPYPEGEGIFFANILPDTMQALNDDPSPEAQMRATVTYHQVIEGVLAEYGYRLFYLCIDQREILPGLREGLRNIQVDESRHIAFGTYFAQRLIYEHPELEAVFIAEMDRMHEITTKSNRQLPDRWSETFPFGIDAAIVVKLTNQFFKQRREAVLKGGLIVA